MPIQQIAPKKNQNHRLKLTFTISSRGRMYMIDFTLFIYSYFSIKQGVRESERILCPIISIVFSNFSPYAILAYPPGFL